MTSFRVALVTFLVASLAACGGGGGGGTTEPMPEPEPPENCTGSGSVTVSGDISFERVPVAQDVLDTPFLDFGGRFPSPVRQARVQAICPDDGSVYATTNTNDLGGYELTVPENVSVRVRVLAEMSRTETPSWTVRVVDNTSGGSLWSVTGTAFDSGTGSLTVNLLAESGWSDGSNSYANSRSAAPFALLDSVYDAMLKVLDADPVANFSELRVNWSPNNTYGSIGTTYYTNGQIFVLGDASTDTDEYDQHVVVHEWGHYFEDRFARSDSIGGGHTSDDRLDVRVAFGEGWGNAWSGMATGDNIYKDTFATSGSPGGTGFAIGLESKEDSSSPPTSSGWFDEGSIQRIIFDIYDDVTDADGDSVALSLGFEEIYQVLTTTQKNTALATNLFPFIRGLMMIMPYEPELNDRLAVDNIAAVTDAEGSGRTNIGGAAIADKYIIPLFTPLTVGGGAVEVCSTDVYTSSTYDNSNTNSNKLGTRRFATFTTVLDSVVITVDGSMNTASNPDFYVFSHGEFLAAGTTTSSKVETRAVSLSEGSSDDFVIELWDVLNTNTNETDGQDNCYQVSVVAN